MAPCEPAFRVFHSSIEREARERWDVRRRGSPCQSVSVKLLYSRKGGKSRGITAETALA